MKLSQGLFFCAAQCWKNTAVIYNTPVVCDAKNIQIIPTNNLLI